MTATTRRSFRVQSTEHSNNLALVAWRHHQRVAREQHPLRYQPGEDRHEFDFVHVLHDTILAVQPC